MSIISAFNADNLYVRVYDRREAMGRSAAREAADRLRQKLLEQETVTVMFAAAPSQNEFLAALSEAKDIAWSRVQAFHMDEYLGLETGHPASFGQFLKSRLFDKLPFGQVFYIDGQTRDPAGEAKRYADLLAEHPLDLCFLGVGENGHIAFNDPPVADFDDPEGVKVVELEDACRRQQVHDGCFPDLDAVPRQAITVTIPGLMRADHLFCMVPGATKAAAIDRLITEDPNPGCPATILKTHRDARLYLDTSAAQQLQE